MIAPSPRSLKIFPMFKIQWPRDGEGKLGTPVHGCRWMPKPLTQGRTTRLHTTQPAAPSQLPQGAGYGPWEGAVSHLNSPSSHTPPSKLETAPWPPRACCWLVVRGVFMAEIFLHKINDLAAQTQAGQVRQSINNLLTLKTFSNSPMPSVSAESPS